MYGVYTVWQEEVNFRIQAYIGLFVVGAALWFRFSRFEWIVLVFCIGAILSAEMLNTAVEDLCDRVEPAYDPLIGKVKDIMAGFVFIVSCGALITGSVLFLGYL